MEVNWESLVLTDVSGREHKLFEHEFWFLAAAKASWEPSDGPTPPTGFAMFPHNAKINQGLVPAMDERLTGIEPKVMKGKAPGAAEAMFERVRAEHYSSRPSRLRCHFLSLSRRQAELRTVKWSWEDRKRVLCYLVLSSGSSHYDDVTDHEEAAKGNIDEALAHGYWSELKGDFFSSDRVEVLANSTLYCSDWEAFPTVSKADLMLWDEYRRR